jgi:hypothetical protein
MAFARPDRRRMLYVHSVASLKPTGPSGFLRRTNDTKQIQVLRRSPRVLWFGASCCHNCLKPKCQNAPRQACCLVRGPSGARTSRRNQGIALSRQNTPERANAVAQLAQKAQVLALAKFNSRIGGLHREELKFTVNTAFRWKHLRLPIYLKHTVIQHDVTSSYALKQ